MVGYTGKGGLPSSCIQAAAQPKKKGGGLIWSSQKKGLEKGAQVVYSMTQGGRGTRGACHRSKKGKERKQCSKGKGKKFRRLKERGSPLKRMVTFRGRGGKRKKRRRGRNKKPYHRRRYVRHNQGKKKKGGGKRKEV